MTQRSHLHIAAALAALVGGTAACGGSQAPAEAPPSIIRVDGSSTVFPITEAVAEEFQRATPGQRVTVGISGTGGGFQKFCRGETDISDASRPIKPTELEACQKAGIDFIELPIAYDGISVVVNPKNTWADRMTVTELRKLWSPEAQGQVKRWNQIRPDWPDREIHLFGAGVDSGTFDYFTEVINGKAQASRGDYTASEDDNVLVQGIGNDELALGYFGFAYYEENQDKLKVLAIDDENPDNGAGAIAPSPQSIRDGTYQPLSRPIFIYPSTKALARPEIKAFIDYYLTKGNPLIREVGYVPLTDSESALVQARFSAGRTGTSFGGPVEPGATLEAILSKP